VGAATEAKASAVHYCLAILLSLFLIVIVLVLALHPFG